MTTDHLTIAVTEIAEKTLENYNPFLSEYIEELCPPCEGDAEETQRMTDAIHGILQLIAAGTADTIVKTFAYAFRMDD